MLFAVGTQYTGYTGELCAFRVIIEVASNPCRPMYIAWHVDGLRQILKYNLTWIGSSSSLLLPTAASG
jgi:hypothetical protein